MCSENVISKNFSLSIMSFENDWCAQCFTQRPIIQKIKNKYPDKLNVEFINADKNTLVVNKYDIQSTPSLLLFKDGEVVERIPKFIDTSQLETLIQYYL